MLWKTLSLGMLMHVKCIHEHCIVLLIFQSYLHHIRVISLFILIVGIFHSFPIFLELTLHSQKTLFSIFLMFRGPKRCPNDLIFCGDYFLEGTKCRRKGSKRTETQGSKEVGPCGQIPWSRGTTYPGPRASDAVDLCPRAFILA